MATEILSLSEISQSQASKYVTHNTALRQIEGQTIHVETRGNTDAPNSPATDGEVHLVASSGATGDWSGQDGNIAHYYSGSWKFYTPTAGMRFWVDPDQIMIIYDETQSPAAWVEVYPELVDTATTTDGTQTTVRSVSVPSGQVLMFEINAYGIEASTGSTYSAIIRGSIRNFGGSTALVGTTKEEYDTDSPSVWDLSVDANDSTDALDVKVTGELSSPATTISWKVATKVRFL